MATRKRSTPGRDRLLLEVVAAIGAGRVLEQYIIDEERASLLISGLCLEGGQVVMNPAVDTVHILLHEMIHRLYWRWSEKRVADAAQALFLTLSHEEVQTIYDLYNTVKTIREARPTRRARPRAPRRRGRRHAE